MIPTPSARVFWIWKFWISQERKTPFHTSADDDSKRVKVVNWANEKGLYDNNFFKQTLNHPTIFLSPSTRAKAKNSPKYNIMITSYQAHMAADLYTFLDGALVTSGCWIKSRFSFIAALKRNRVEEAKREKNFPPNFHIHNACHFFPCYKNFNSTRLGWDFSFR